MTGCYVSQHSFGAGLALIQFCEKQTVALSESIAKSMASSDYVLCSTAILGVYQFPTHEY